MDFKAVFDSEFPKAKEILAPAYRPARPDAKGNRRWHGVRRVWDIDLFWRRREDYESWLRLTLVVRLSNGGTEQCNGRR
jgi:hypothetical protein